MENYRKVTMTKKDDLIDDVFEKFNPAITTCTNH